MQGQHDRLTDASRVWIEWHRDLLSDSCPLYWMRTSNLCHSIWRMSSGLSSRAWLHLEGTPTVWFWFPLWYLMSTAGAPLHCFFYGPVASPAFGSASFWFADTPSAGETVYSDWSKFQGGATLPCETVHSDWSKPAQIQFTQWVTAWFAKTDWPLSLHTLPLCANQRTEL